MAENLSKTEEQLQKLTRAMMGMERSMESSIRTSMAMDKGVGSLADEMVGLEKQVSQAVNEMKELGTTGEQSRRRMKEWASATRELNEKTKLYSATLKIMTRNSQSWGDRMADSMKKTQGAMNAVGSGIQNLTGLTIGLDRMQDHLMSYNRTMFETTRIAHRFGESVSEVESAFDRVTKNTTLSRKGFAELNHSFKNLYVGVPPTTKAVAEFAETLMGKVGYSEQVVIDRTKTMLNIQKRIPGIMDQIKRASSRGASGLQELRIVLGSVGVAGQEMQQILDMAQPVPTKGIKGFMQFEQSISKSKQRMEDSQLTLEQKLVPTMELAADAASRLADMLSRVDSSLMNIAGMAAIGTNIGAPFAQGAVGIGAFTTQVLAMKMAMGKAAPVAKGGGSGIMEVGTAAAGTMAAKGKGLFSKIGKKAPSSSSTSSYSGFDIKGENRTIQFNPTSKTAGDKISSFGSKVARSNALKGVGGFAKRSAPVAALVGGLEGYQEYKESRERYGKGKSLASGAAKGAGAGLGLVGGMAVGSAIGTAIMPVVGTAIGGAIGLGVGMLGAWGGGKAGDYLSNKITPEMTEGDEKIFEDAKLIKENRGSMMLDAAATAGVDDKYLNKYNKLLEDGKITQKEAADQALKLIKSQSVKANNEKDAAAQAKVYAAQQRVVASGLVTQKDLTSGIVGEIKDMKQLIGDVYGRWSALDSVFQISYAKLEKTTALMKEIRTTTGMSIEHGETISRFQEEGLMGGDSGQYRSAAVSRVRLAGSIRQAKETEFNVRLARTLKYDKDFAKQFDNDPIAKEKIKSLEANNEEKARLIPSINSLTLDFDNAKSDAERDRIQEKLDKAKEDYAAVETSDKKILESDGGALKKKIMDKIKLGNPSQGMDEISKDLEMAMVAARNPLEHIDFVNRFAGTSLTIGSDLNEVEAALNAIDSAAQVASAQLGVMAESVNQIKLDMIEASNREIKADLGPIIQEVNLNEQNVSLAKQRMDLAEANNLGLIKSYQYTKEAVESLTNQIGVEEQINQKLDERIIKHGQEINLQIDVQSAMNNRVRFNKILKAYADKHTDSEAESIKAQAYINNELNKRIEGEQKVLSLATEQAQLTRQVREGYLEAFQESEANIGVMTKLIGTQTKGVTQLLDSGAYDTFAYGGTGKNIRKANSGYIQEAPRWSQNLGVMDGSFNQMGLNKYTDVNKGFTNILDGSGRKQLVNIANQNLNKDTAMMLNGQTAKDGFEAVQEVAVEGHGATVRGLVVLHHDLENIARQGFFSPSATGGQGFAGINTAFSQGYGGDHVANTAPGDRPIGGNVLGSNPVVEGSMPTFSNQGSNTNKPIIQGFAQGGYVIKKSAVDANQEAVKALGGKIFSGGIPGRDSIPIQFSSGSRVAQGLVQAGEAYVHGDADVLAAAEIINKAKGAKIGRYADGGFLTNTIGKIIGYPYADKLDSIKEKFSFDNLMGIERQRGGGMISDIEYNEKAPRITDWRKYAQGGSFGLGGQSRPSSFGMGGQSRPSSFGLGQKIKVAEEIKAAEERGITSTRASDRKINSSEILKSRREIISRMSDQQKAFSKKYIEAVSRRLNKYHQSKIPISPYEKRFIDEGKGIQNEFKSASDRKKYDIYKNKILIDSEKARLGSYNIGAKDSSVKIGNKYYNNESLTNSITGSTGGEERGGEYLLRKNRNISSARLDISDSSRKYVKAAIKRLNMHEQAGGKLSKNEGKFLRASRGVKPQFKDKSEKDEYDQYRINLIKQAREAKSSSETQDEGSTISDFSRGYVKTAIGRLDKYDRAGIKLDENEIKFLRASRGIKPQFKDSESKKEYDKYRIDLIKQAREAKRNSTNIGAKDSTIRVNDNYYNASDVNSSLINATGGEERLQLYRGRNQRGSVGKIEDPSMQITRRDAVPTQSESSPQSVKVELAANMNKQLSDFMSLSQGRAKRVGAQYG